MKFINIHMTFFSQETTILLEREGQDDPSNRTAKCARLKLQRRREAYQVGITFSEEVLPVFIPCLTRKSASIGKLVHPREVNLI